MKKTLLCASVVLLLALASIDAHASLLYEQLPHGTGSALVSSLDPSFSPGSDYRVWDDFTLASNSTITGINWWGFHLVPGTRHPVLYVYVLSR